MISIFFFSFDIKLFIIIFKQVFLKDTDERACAYISGPAPNRWGVTVEGLELLESVSQISRTDGGFFCPEYVSYPDFLMSLMMSLFFFL